jgi:hypothetical protein
MIAGGYRENSLLTLGDIEPLLDNCAAGGRLGGSAIPSPSSMMSEMFVLQRNKSSYGKLISLCFENRSVRVSQGVMDAYRMDSQIKVSQFAKNSVFPNDHGITWPVTLDNKLQINFNRIPRKKQWQIIFPDRSKAI